MRDWGRFAVILLAVVVTAVACTGRGAALPQGINEGNRARDFTLEALDGTNVSLQDYLGSVVLINFWATWCPPCADEIPDLQATYEARKDDGFVVLGVNVEESREVVAPFVASYDVTYPVLLDETGNVIKMYRALGLPVSVIVDQDGVIQVRHVGYVTAAQLEGYLAELLP